MFRFEATTAAVFGLFLLLALIFAARFGASVDGALERSSADSEPADSAPGEGGNHDHNGGGGGGEEVASEDFGGADLRDLFAAAGDDDDPQHQEQQQQEAEAETSARVCDPRVARLVEPFVAEAFTIYREGGDSLWLVVRAEVASTMCSFITEMAEPDRTAHITALETLGENAIGQKRRFYEAILEPSATSLKTPVGRAARDSQHFYLEQLKELVVRQAASRRKATKQRKGRKRADQRGAGGASSSSPKMASGRGGRRGGEHGDERAEEGAHADDGERGWLHQVQVLVARWMPSLVLRVQVLAELLTVPRFPVDASSSVPLGPLLECLAQLTTASVRAQLYKRSFPILLARWPSLLTTLLSHLFRRPGERRKNGDDEAFAHEIDQLIRAQARIAALPVFSGRCPAASDLEFHDTDGQCQPEKQKEEEMAMIQDSEEEAGGCVGWRRTTACYQCFALINGANDRMDRVAAVLDRLGRFNEGDEFLLTVFFDVVTTRLDEDGSGNEGEEVPSVEELVKTLDHLLLVRYAWVPHTHVVFAEVFKQKRAIRSMLLELFAESLPSASLLTFLYQATVEVCKTADLFLAVLERWLRSLATISQALPHVFPLRRSTVEDSKRETEKRRVVSFGETVVEPRKWLAIYVLLLSSNEDKTKGGTSAAEKGGERPPLIPPHVKALFAAIQGAGLVGAKGATVVNGVLGDPHFLLHQTLRELVVGEGKHTGLQQQELGLVVARLGDGFSLAGHLWGAANRQTKQEVEEDPGKETTKTKKKKKEAHGEDQFCPFTFALLFYLDGNIDSGEKKEAKEGQMQKLAAGRGRRVRVLADFLSSGVHLDCPFVEALCGRDAMLADFWAAYAAAQMETLGNVRKWRNMVWDRDRWTAWRHELATKADPAQLELRLRFYARLREEVLDAVPIWNSLREMFGQEALEERNPIDEKLLAVGLANLTLALYALRPKSARDTVLAALRAYHQAHNFQNHKVLHPSQVADILKNPLVVDPQTGPDLTHFSDCLALLNKIMDEMSSLPGFFGYSVFQVFDELLPLPRELHPQLLEYVGKVCRKLTTDGPSSSSSSPLPHKKMVVIILEALKAKIRTLTGAPPPSEKSPPKRPTSVKKGGKSGGKEKGEPSQTAPKAAVGKGDKQKKTKEVSTAEDKEATKAVGKDGEKKKKKTMKKEVRRKKEGPPAAEGERKMHER